MVKIFHDSGKHVPSLQPSQQSLRYSPQVVEFRRQFCPARPSLFPSWHSLSWYARTQHISTAERHWPCSTGATLATGPVKVSHFSPSLAQEVPSPQQYSNCDSICISIAKTPANQHKSELYSTTIVADDGKSRCMVGGYKLK